MNNINACFVSYRHTADPDAHALVTAFVRQLKKQLMWWLPNSKVYFDENALKVGDQYNKELALQQLTKANAPPWSERGYLADMGRDLGSALP